MFNWFLPWKRKDTLADKIACIPKSNSNKQSRASKLGWSRKKLLQKKRQDKMTERLRNGT